MKIGKIRIMAQWFTIEESNPEAWGTNCQMGRSNSMNGTILIRSDMPEDIKLGTLIHEIVHVVADMNGVQLKEHVVASLANGLMTVLKDNAESLWSEFAPSPASAVP